MIHGQLCHTCNTCVVVLGLLHMLNMCITNVFATEVLPLLVCICNAYVGYTPVLHMQFYTCQMRRLYNCITCVKCVYYRCSTMY